MNEKKFHSDSGNWMNVFSDLTILGVLVGGREKMKAIDNKRKILEKYGQSGFFFRSQFWILKAAEIRTEHERLKCADLARVKSGYRDAERNEMNSHKRSGTQWKNLGRWAEGRNCILKLFHVNAKLTIYVWGKRGRKVRKTTEENNERSMDGNWQTIVNPPRDVYWSALRSFISFQYTEQCGQRRQMLMNVETERRRRDFEYFGVKWTTKNPYTWDNIFLVRVENIYWTNNGSKILRGHLWWGNLNK